MRRSRRRTTPAAVRLTLLGMLVGTVAGFSLGGLAARPARSATSHTVAGFHRVVFLSHINDPRRTPGFPGDPRFFMTTAFTVPNDGYYLQYVREGEHTGTHWGAPCHFHVDALCADQLDPADLVLPAVVIDIRSRVAHNVDYRLSVADLERWEATYGPMPENAAVILRTGCDSFWGSDSAPRDHTYYNCGSGMPGLHQPGFSLRAVHWLIARGVLGLRGALGTDTFGPDPGTDENFRESSLVFHRHRIDLENLTNVGALPPAGSWIVVGGPRNSNGSGSPATIYGFVP
ncbi:MAG: cyclase family protein [Actinomycetota bacterium]|nr:cyclase family protein [Actinomycetota bacterium]